ncbi:hypothetical protein VTK73DRAFT_4400 [Phialemonium thermophilum]|uniref:Uncharacterized protein n=1 Tax=Phialemonium thermophilum TaxID=223376 RepID=A0ABR3WTP9_9PEZI
MSTNHGSAGFSPFPDKPWVWIAIPLGVVGGLGILAVLIHTRRRRRIKARLLISSDPNARQALERDLQEAWVRGATAVSADGSSSRTPPYRSLLRSPPNPLAPSSTTSPLPPPRSRWVRPSATRWAWAHNVLQARPEEGLNELGEAPPPYDGRKRDGGAQSFKLDNTGEPNVIEMNSLGTRQLEGEAYATASEGSLPSTTAEIPRRGSVSAGVLGDSTIGQRRRECGLTQSPPGYIELLDGDGGGSGSGNAPNRQRRFGTELPPPSPAILAPDSGLRPRELD